MFTVERKEMQEALKVLSRIAPRHSHIPVLPCVLLSAAEEGVLMTATDLEIGATLCVPAASGHPGRGKVVANAGQLSAIVAAAKDEEIPVEIDGESFAIGSARLRSAGNPDEFPEIPRPPKKPLAEYVPDPDFALALAYCAPVVSKEITRYALTGLYFDFRRGTLVGSDGKRLHVAVMGEAENVPAVILPPRIFSIVCPEEIVIPPPGKEDEGPGYVFFNLPNGTAYTRILEGSYPDYAAIVPKKCPTCFETDRAVLMEALRSILPLMSPRALPCTVSADGDLGLSVGDAGGGAQCALAVEGHLRGKPCAVRVNPLLLRDALEGLPGDVVRVHFQGSKGALVIEDPESSWFGIVMPLKDTGDENHANQDRPGAGGQVQAQPEEAPAGGPPHGRA